MAKQTINVSTPNSGRGDPLRTAFSKINANFTELYAGGASESQLTNGAYTVTLGADGTLTLPVTANGGIITGTGTAAVALRAPAGSQAVLENNAGYNLILAQDQDVRITTSPDAGSTFYTWNFGTNGKITFPNNYTFTGQTLTDTSGTTNYSLKIANGTTGSVFAVGTGTDAYGVANDALDHTQTTYVPYNATASTMSFNIPGAVGSLVIGPTGVVTVPNGLVIPTGTKAANATGTTGQISYDANYMYICVATNTWKRSPLTGGY